MGKFYSMINFNKFESKRSINLTDNQFLAYLSNIYWIGCIQIISEIYSGLKINII
jgi:hypothetical protein